MDYKLFLKNHKRIDLLQWVFRHINNSSVVDDILHVKYGNRFYSRELHEINNPCPGTVYHIDTSAPRRGFFAMYYHLLCALLYSDIKQFIPYITFQNTTYQETEPIFGSNNPYEYYFVQPCITKTDSSRKMFEYNDIHRFLIEELFGNGQDSYYYGNALFEKLVEINKKYIKFNDRTNTYLESNVMQLLNNRIILGVHYRGTDYNSAFYGHPVIVSVHEYIKKVAELMDDGDYDKIFLATDDSEAEKEFKKFFGNDILLFDDVSRSKGLEASFLNESTRKNHHYLLGLEVIRDMVTLSKCDGLVCGLSQVTNIARLYKRCQDKDYTQLYVFDKGLVQERNYYKVNF